MRHGRLRTVLFLMTTLPFGAAGALQGPAAPDDAKTIDEVVVTGRLASLRDAAARAEDRFYDRYNELNDDRQFDMHCVSEAPTGTRLAQRTCRIAYYEQALELESRAWMEAKTAPPAYSIYLLRYDDYRKHLAKVVATHPELMQLLEERNRLQQRYERELKRRRGGR